MKSFIAAAILFFAFSAAFAQNEQSPIVEKDINYKNWTYKNVRTGEDTSLRTLSAGKKLVIVVYYAPWCPNWRHDAPFLQRFYDKYKANGLEIIGVGEYDPVSSMRTNLDMLKVTFPVVYESELRTDKQKTQHYDYRRYTGDTRGWGSPWYILLEPKTFEKGDTLVKRTNVINGEMIEIEGEKFIRKKLGLPDETAPKRPVAQSSKVEVCDPAKPIAAATVKKP